jgi:DNA-binding protein Fis
MWALAAGASERDDFLQARTRVVNGRSIVLLHYVHVPKCGSNFASTLLLYGCPHGNWSRFRAGVLEPAFFFRCNRECKANFQFIKSGHDGFPATLQPYNVVTMLREPLDRMVSGYFHDLHDLDNCSKYTALNEQARLKGMVDKQLVLVYADCTQSIATKMLGAGKNASDNEYRVTEADVARARYVVENAFFVGITDFFGCSVDKLSALLGIERRPLQTEKMRERNNHTDHDAQRVRSILQEGFRDRHDEVLYAMAKMRLGCG